MTSGGTTRTTLRARLVVGADGHRSTVAQLARVPEDSDPEIARRIALFSMRAAEPSVLLNPKVITVR